MIVREIYALNISVENIRKEVLVKAFDLFVCLVLI